MPRSEELTELFDRHADHVWRVLRRFGVPERDVEDVVQDVFLVVHRKLADYEGRGRFRTWLYGICRRCAAAYRRRAHRRHETTMETVPDVGGDPPQEGELARRRLLVWLDRVLADLPEVQRETYVLYELEELPMAEVARVLDCPLQTAYARLYAARRAVRRAVAGQRSVA